MYSTVGVLLEGWHEIFDLTEKDNYTSVTCHLVQIAYMFPCVRYTAKGWPIATHFALHTPGIALPYLFRKHPFHIILYNATFCMLVQAHI